MDQHHITGISRFLKEIPEELLSEESKLSSSENLDATFNNKNQKEWGYGNSKSKVITYEIEKTANYRNSISFESKIGSSKNIGIGNVAASSFGFKTPETFLNSLNKKHSTSIDISQYKQGTRVYHKKFGEGTINYVEEEGEDYKVDISFDKVGHKRLMANFAGLEIL